MKNVPAKKRAEAFIDSGYRVPHEQASRQLTVDDSLSLSANLAAKPSSLGETFEMRERAYLIRKGLLRPSSDPMRVVTAPFHKIGIRTLKTSDTTGTKTRAARVKTGPNKKQSIGPHRGSSIESSLLDVPISEPKRCELCGQPKLSARHEQDFCLKRGRERNAHKEVVHLTSKPSPKVIHYLDFDPFPPSTISHRDAYRLLYGLKRTIAYFDKYEDPIRAKRILELGPIITHLGKKAWKGYAVYEFGDRFQGRVVLESIMAPNATYILSPRWRMFISLSKMNVRQEYPNECSVVIHQDQWHKRVLEALECKRLGVV